MRSQVNHEKKRPAAVTTGKIEAKTKSMNDYNALISSLTTPAELEILRQRYGEVAVSIWDKRQIKTWLAYLNAICFWMMFKRGLFVEVNDHVFVPTSFVKEVCVESLTQERGVVVNVASKWMADYARNWWPGAATGRPAYINKRRQGVDLGLWEQLDGTFGNYALPELYNVDLLAMLVFAEMLYKELQRRGGFEEVQKSTRGKPAKDVNGLDVLTGAHLGTYMKLMFNELMMVCGGIAEWMKPSNYWGYCGSSG